jgi:hypothetical protein
METAVSGPHHLEGFGPAVYRHIALILGGAQPCFEFVSSYFESVVSALKLSDSHREARDQF